jgi:DnaJ-class molecular chaperone
VSKITHILTGEECGSCKGRGRVRGGQIEYGELVSCPLCDGKGYLVKAITLMELVRLIEMSPSAGRLR